jgi:hypothetical protein
LAGASDAEARPAIATNRAKNRITVCIFGNLSGSDLKGKLSLLEIKAYLQYLYKSSKFNYILNKN